MKKIVAAAILLLFLLSLMPSNNIILAYDTSDYTIHLWDLQTVYYKKNVQIVNSTTDPDVDNDNVVLLVNDTSTNDFCRVDASNTYDNLPTDSVYYWALCIKLVSYGTTTFRFGGLPLRNTAEKNAEVIYFTFDNGSLALYFYVSGQSYTTNLKVPNTWCELWFEFKISSDRKQLHISKVAIDDKIENVNITINTSNTIDRAYYDFTVETLNQDLCTFYVDYAVLTANSFTPTFQTQSSQETQSSSPQPYEESEETKTWWQNFRERYMPQLAKLGLVFLGAMCMYAIMTGAVKVFEKGSKRRRR